MTSLSNTPQNIWCHKYIYQLTFSSKRCWKCSEQLLFRSSYAWCRVCRQKTSAKAATWLRGAKLSYRHILQLLWCWQARKSPGFVVDALGLSYTTIRRWYDRFRRHLPQDTADKLSTLVEVDESFFGKQRYRNQKIVIGAIEPLTRRIKLGIIADREAETLERFVRSSVEPGSVVMTDSHPSYNELAHFGYNHFAFNHSKGEYSNTNQIENLWGVIKRHMRRMYGCIPTKHLQSHLDEWTARQNRPDIFTSPENYLDACLFRIS